MCLSRYLESRTPACINVIAFIENTWRNATRLIFKMKESCGMALLEMH